MQLQIWMSCRQSCFFLFSSSGTTYWCRSVCVHRSSDSIWCTTLISGLKEGTISSYEIIAVGGLLLTLVVICLESVTGLFKNFVWSIRKGTFYRGLYILCAGSTLFVDFSSRIRSAMLIALLVVTTNTGCSISSGFANCFVTPIGACPCSSGLDILCDNVLDNLETSMSLPQIGTSGGCIGSVFLFIAKDYSDAVVCVRCA